MKKKLLFLSLVSALLFPLVSCSYNKTFVVERSLKNEVVDISLSEFKTKLDNNDRFILYLYSDECYACYVLKNEFLNSFINKTHIKFYGFRTDEYDKKEALLFRDISSKSSYYQVLENEYNEEEIYFIYPTMLLIENGKVIKSATGGNEINQKFFDKNVYLDRNVSKYKVSEDYKISLENSQNPSFLIDDENILNRIVYTTNSLENDQVNYYLKPFINDYSVNIYYRIDETIESPILEVIKNGQTVNKTDKQSNFLSLLDSYIKKSN
jgi:hypothetical protein